MAAFEVLILSRSGGPGLNTGSHSFSTGWVLPSAFKVGR